MPERLLGVLAVDPLGAVGDGRWPEFDDEIFRRTPESVRERAREIDELSTAGEVRVPVGFVHGSRSPMPLRASTDAAERIPGAWVDVVEGAGHFIWVEAPGAVQATLRRLTAGWIAGSAPGGSLPNDGTVAQATPLGLG